jgi:hypothetical protein
LWKPAGEFQFVDFIEKSIDLNDAWASIAVRNSKVGIANEALPIILKTKTIFFALLLLLAKDKT